MKRKKLEFKFIFLIFLIILVIIFILFNFLVDDNRKLTPLEGVVKDTGSFIQKIFLAPVNLISDKIREIKIKNKLYDNYVRDEEKLANYERLQAENESLKIEINKLKETFEINKIFNEYKFSNATVINRNVSYWNNSITIDKGSFHGVVSGMAVITSKGLIGKITNITNFTSTVKLVTSTDANFLISVNIISDKKTYTGLLKSYDENKNIFEVDCLSNDVKVKERDKIVTSGLSEIFPKGILIGTVQSTTLDEYGLSKILNVLPSEDYNDIRYVTILKREDGNK